MQARARCSQQIKECITAFSATQVINIKLFENTEQKNGLIRKQELPLKGDRACFPVRQVYGSIDLLVLLLLFNFCERTYCVRTDAAYV
jgi:hypothetical protein